MALYTVNDIIANKYKVLVLIKQAVSAQTYRVRGTDGKLYFLKLFICSKIHRTAFNADGELLEIEYLKAVDHPNIVKYIESGEVIVAHQKYPYLVLEFIAGETLVEKLSREHTINLYDVKEYAKGILNGLTYLHSLSDIIIHNEITINNVMIDLSNAVPVPKIIDFGYARSFFQSSKCFNKEGLSPFYLADECFNHVFSVQTDVFAVGAFMFHLIFGRPPWFKDFSKYQEDRINVEEALLKERKKISLWPENLELDIEVDDEIKKIIKKALCPDTDKRFKSADDFLKALNGEIEVEEIEEVDLQKSINQESESKVFSKKLSGKGFGAIAGMQELKNLLQRDVINALKNPQEYEKYGITIPNGMLLYGPPGCGKTFFSKRFAEEVGFNFIDIKPSTLQSKFINATQENIAKMFIEAEKDAPTIIFIDELDALVPNREGDLHQMYANAVNEFLTQINECGSRGIFIIGASNRPEKIDPAILRAGRLEKKIYLPPPDFEARKAMFEMYLKDRPLDFGIDYTKLSQLTENYVSADIDLIVNDASRKALGEKARISMEILEYIIGITKPTVSLAEIRKYEILKEKMEGDIQKDTIRKSIGFKKNDL